MHPPRTASLIREVARVLPAPENLSVERLVRDGVALFVIRSDGLPSGCGGLKLLGSGLSAWPESVEHQRRETFGGRAYGRA